MVWYNISTKKDKEKKEMKKYFVRIARVWEVEVEAEDEKEAKELAYEEVYNSYTYDYDEVKVCDLGEEEEE